MLNELLQNRQCFKMVCGAGNEDIDEVEKLVALYAMAGARYFDLSANIEVVKAAYRGLERVIPKEKQKNYYMNVSVGIKGDPHVSKSIIYEDVCRKCGACEKRCPQEAISFQVDKYIVNKARCIGCSKCASMCKFGAIEIVSVQKNLDEVLPPLVSLGIDSIELHVVGDDDELIYKQWDAVKRNFDGILSICTDRSHASDVKLKERIEKMLEGRKPYSVIIQADGVPMGGGSDDFATTLQTVATAQIVERMNLPVYILLSGGTNSKTGELAKLCNVCAHGVSLGTYGREIVRKYTKRNDFWDNEEVFDKALNIAKKLVDDNMKFYI